MLDIAIIGAGPYGISLGAHAEKTDLQYTVFGYPMDFWQSKMPPKMFIRTLLEFSNLSDPDEAFTLANYQSEKGIHFSYPLSRTDFVDYGKWFIAKARISMEEVLITDIINHEKYFEIRTESGMSTFAKHVVIAVGVTNAQHIPYPLLTLPKGLVSHTANYTHFDQFSNQHVLVVGGGQSAWEAAALLHEANAKVDLVYRRPERLEAPRDGNARQHELASQYYYLTDEEKEKVRTELDRPTVSDFLVPLVEGKVRQIPYTSIAAVREMGDNQVQVTFNDQTKNTYDHIIAATGYRYSIDKLSFLQPLIEKIQVNESGQPIVNENFESNVSNFFFAGPATDSCHGPTFKFIAGVRRTCSVLVDYINKQKRQNLLK